MKIYQKIKNPYIRISLIYVSALVVAVVIGVFIILINPSDPSGKVSVSVDTGLGTFLAFWFVLFIKSLFSIRKITKQFKHKKA